MINEMINHSTNNMNGMPNHKRLIAMGFKDSLYVQRGKETFDMMHCLRRNDCSIDIIRRTAKKVCTLYRDQIEQQWKTTDYDSCLTKGEENELKKYLRENLIPKIKQTCRTLVWHYSEMFEQDDLDWEDIKNILQAAYHTEDVLRKDLYILVRIADQILTSSCSELEKCRPEGMIVEGERIKMHVVRTWDATDYYLFVGENLVADAKTCFVAFHSMSATDQELLTPVIRQMLEKYGCEIKTCGYSSRYGYLWVSLPENGNMIQTYENCKREVEHVKLHTGELKFLRNYYMKAA